MAASVSTGLVLEALESYGNTCLVLRPSDGGRRLAVRVFNLSRVNLTTRHFPPGTHVDNCHHSVTTVEQWVMFLPTLMTQSEEYDADEHLHLCVTSEPVDEELVTTAMSHASGKHKVDFVVGKAMKDDESYSVLSKGLYVPHPDASDIHFYDYGSYQPRYIESIPFKEGTFYPGMNVSTHTRMAIVIRSADVPHSLGFMGPGALDTVVATNVVATMSRVVNKHWFPLLLEILHSLERNVKNTHETLSEEDFVILLTLSEKGRRLLHAEHYKPADDTVRLEAKKFQEFILSLSLEGKAKVDFEVFSQDSGFLRRTRNLFEMSPVHSAPSSHHIYRQVSGGHLES